MVPKVICARANRVLTRWHSVESAVCRRRSNRYRTLVGGAAKESPTVGRPREIPLCFRRNSSPSGAVNTRVTRCPDGLRSIGRPIRFPSRRQQDRSAQAGRAPLNHVAPLRDVLEISFLDSSESLRRSRYHCRFPRYQPRWPCRPPFVPAPGGGGAGLRTAD